MPQTLFRSRVRAVSSKSDVHVEEPGVGLEYDTLLVDLGQQPAPKSVHAMFCWAMKSDILVVPEE